MIFEAIIITTDIAGNPHVRPFGVCYQDELVVISPFRPSTTLENVLATKCAVMNIIDDVRVFAGALTGRQAWQLNPATNIQGYVLDDALVHRELVLVEVKQNTVRPTLYFETKHQVCHKPFLGYNRAQAAVVELAVLASRLNILPMEKITAEMRYLQIAIDKTAGERELQAWSWLCEKIENYQAEQTGRNLA